MFRIRSAIALAAVICLASATVATAASGPKVTLRGTTTVTLSSSFASALSAAGVTVSPTSPATGASQAGSSSSSSSGSSLSFPIRGGAVHSNPYTSAAYTEGGLTFNMGDKSASVDALVVLLNRNGSLDLTTLRRVGHKRVCASVYRQHRRQCGTVAVHKFVPLAQAPTLSRTNDKTVSGTLDLTADGAQVIDTLTGSTTVSAGDPLGTINVAPSQS